MEQSMSLWMVVSLMALLLAIGVSIPQF